MLMKIGDWVKSRTKGALPAWDLFPRGEVVRLLLKFGGRALMK